MNALLRGRGVLSLIAAGLVLAPVIWIGVSAFNAERRGFVASHHAPRLSLEEFRVPGLSAVSFSSRAGQTLRGYFAPSKNGAAIVLTHGSSGERSDVADETKALSEAGFGVLAFDWPGHGESDGVIRWGSPEREALEAALDWIGQQPSVNPARLGAYGFSMGGYIVTQVAASDARLKAVALAGTPHDPVEQTCWEYRRFGKIASWPALLAVRLSGMDVHDRVPERVVMNIAPRALLIISGTEDPIAPPWMSERLWGAAREPKQFLRVRGAGHGAYAAAGGSYAQDLTRFFATYLSA